MAKKNNATQNCEAVAEYTILTDANFSVKNVGFYKTEGFAKNGIIEIKETYHNSGRQLCSKGVITFDDGTTLEKDGAVSVWKKVFGATVNKREFSATATSHGAKVLTDDQITKIVAEFAGVLSLAVDNVNKRLARVDIDGWGFGWNITTPENKPATVAEFVDAYRSAIIAKNETAKADKAKADATAKANAEQRERNNASRDIATLIKQGKIDEAMALMAQMKNATTPETAPETATA